MTSGQPFRYDLLAQRFIDHRPDRSGNVYIECPNCQRRARDQKCAFSPKGWNCFICGEGGTLKSLCVLLGIEDGERPDPYVVPPPPPKPIVRRWQTEPMRFLKQFTAHPQRIELWQAYRPFSLESIAFWRLGVGRLPNVRCDHPRLIYPATKNRRIVGFRGRAISCDCPKWLSSAGSTATLCGVAKPHKPLWVVESPIDAYLILQEMRDIGAIAGTAGANTWKDEWTAWITKVCPEFVVVLYDNDLPGAATGAMRERLEIEWMLAHPKATHPPAANADKVARRLRSAGLSVSVARWPDNAPEGADVGWMAMRREYEGRFDDESRV